MLMLEIVLFCKSLWNKMSSKYPTLILKSSMSEPLRWRVQLKALMKLFIMTGTLFKTVSWTVTMTTPPLTVLSCLLLS